MHFDFDDLDDPFGKVLEELTKLPPDQAQQVRREVENTRTPLAPGDPRRHHYVPQFFLRRFADGDQLAVLRRSDAGRHRLSNVRDVAVIKDLYTTLDAEIGETVAIERVLARVDSDAANAIDRLAWGLLFPPSDRDRIDLAVFFSLLSLRGPGHRRQMEAIADHAYKLEFSLINSEERARAFLGGPDGDEPSDDAIRELLEFVGQLDEIEIVPHQNDFIFSMLDCGLRLSPAFLARTWTVFKLSEPGLVLCDQPVMLQHSGARSMAGRGVGLMTAEEILIPLDRQTLLVLHSDEAVRESVIEIPQPAFGLDEFNQFVVANAYEEIYCHPDDLNRVRRLDIRPRQQPLMRASGAGWARGQTDGINSVPQRRSPNRYRRSA